MTRGAPRRLLGGQPMIVAFLKDTWLRTALRRAADRDEDVVFDPVLAALAADVGYPRALVTEAHEGPMIGVPTGVPVIELGRETLARWENERRRAADGTDRLDHLTRCIAREIAALDGVPWVDRVLTDLERVAEVRPPGPLRGFARRILEFPGHYTDLHAVADLTGLSRGALKARFRRRGLTSPYTYLRWFRMMACGQVLSDHKVTVASAAHRLGFTSDGNLCRTMVGLTGLRPSELRTETGWERLVGSFAWSHLGADELERWEGLADLFENAAA